MRSIGIPLEELLGKLSQETEDNEDGPPVTPEAAVMRMMEILPAIVAGKCRFKVGDFVTPRSGMNLRSVGEPHMVIEVFDDPVRVFATSADSEETGSVHNGCRFDMRTVCVKRDRKGIDAVVPFMHESWQFEAWYPTGDDK